MYNSRVRVTTIDDQVCIMLGRNTRYYSGSMLSTTHAIYILMSKIEAGVLDNTSYCYERTASSVWTLLPE